MSGSKLSLLIQRNLDKTTLHICNLPVICKINVAFCDVVVVDDKVVNPNADEMI